LSLSTELQQKEGKMVKKNQAKKKRVSVVNKIKTWEKPGEYRKEKKKEKCKKINLSYAIIIFLRV